jgi:hypothetical protein
MSEEEKKDYYGRRSRAERRLKQIFFDLPEDIFINFSLNLEYDNIGYKEFYTNIISLYLEKDEDFIKCIRKIQDRKVKNKIVNRIKKNYEKLSEQEKEIKRSFGLDKKEISNIFDILEKDFSEK